MAGLLWSDEERWLEARWPWEKEERNGEAKRKEKKMGRGCSCQDDGGGCIPSNLREKLGLGFFRIRVFLYENFFLVPISSEGALYL